MTDLKEMESKTTQESSCIYWYGSRDQYVALEGNVIIFVCGNTWNSLNSILGKRKADKLKALVKKYEG